MNNYGGVSFVKHDEAGRILFTGSVPASMFELQGENTVAGEANLFTDYVKDGVITPRPANPATLAGMQLQNLPVPCTITVEGVDHACEESTADLSFSHAGTYPVKVVAFPWLDVTFEVIQA